MQNEGLDFFRIDILRIVQFVYKSYTVQYFYLYYGSLMNIKAMDKHIMNNTTCTTF